MKDVMWIYILDNKGEPIFIYENYVQGAYENNYILISHLFSSIKSILEKIEGAKIKILKQSIGTFFITKEESNKYYFIVLTSEEGDIDETKATLKQIKKKFVNEYAENLELKEKGKEKREILKSFQNYVKNTFSRESNLDTFLETI